MPRPPVIALIGIDGAGKSTQARLLAEWLTSQGVRAQFVKNPGGRLRMDKIARRLGRPNAISLLGRRTFLVIEVVVRWLMIARALLWSRLTGRLAVMDRYTPCQYAVIRTRRDPGEQVARALYALFPRPELTVLLVAAPAEAQRRIDRRGTDTESLAYLTAMDAAYRSLPEAAEFHMVDANGAPEAVQAALRDAVQARSPLTTPRSRS